MLWKEFKWKFWHNSRGVERGEEQVERFLATAECFILKFRNTFCYKYFKGYGAFIVLEVNWFAYEADDFKEI